MAADCAGARPLAAPVDYARIEDTAHANGMGAGYVVALPVADMNELLRRQAKRL